MLYFTKNIRYTQFLDKKIKSTITHEKTHCVNPGFAIKNILLHVFRSTEAKDQGII